MLQTGVNGCFSFRNVKIYKIIKIFENKLVFSLVVTKYVIYLYHNNKTNNNNFKFKHYENCKHN